MRWVLLAILAVLVAILLARAAVAAPFLVCDPPPAGECVTHYDVTGFDRTPAPLHLDLQGVAPGNHAVEVRAVCVDPLWGELRSAPTPFDFTRPDNPGPVAGVRVEAN